MPDKFRSFSELSLARPNDYAVRVSDQGGHILIFTPHGGGIEPGTSELCRWFGRRLYAYYCFEGTKSPFKDLHITSTRFDEPQLLTLLSTYPYALSFHGMANSVKRKLAGADVFLGGRNKPLIYILQQHLAKAGFAVATTNDSSVPSLNALSKRNVTNKCVTRLGVQIEISESLRKRFFNGSISANARRENRSTTFYRFCKAANKAIRSFF